MAKTTIYHLRLEAASRKIAMAKANQVLNEMEREARFIAATGPYTKGALAASIFNTGAIPRGSRIVGSVGSPLKYAKAVESGARRHDIFPKRAPSVYRFGQSQRPTLKFFWAKAGRTVYPNQIPMAPGTVGVSHPGQHGKGFLRRPLLDAAVRHRMRLIIYDV